MKTDIKIIPATNLKELIELTLIFEEVFEMENFKRPGEEHLRKLLNSKHFFAVVAKSGNNLIAGLTVYVLDQYYSEKPLAYIYDLAVLADYQRKGIGKSLIRFTNEYCLQKGYEEVFVQAYKTDDYAVDFYRSTNPSNEEQVAHFSYKL